MDRDRWALVAKLLQSALDRPAAERDAFVRDACAGDAEIEQEIRSLLAAHDRAGSFLRAPAIDVAAGQIDETHGSDDDYGRIEGGGDRLIGQTLSHYRIVDKLGGGGMGVVYKAEDARLKRFVAVKFLSPDLAGDREALGRFRREARAASALNHANICTVHDIGEDDGRAFLVMEFLDGATLKHRLAGGPLDVDQLVALAIEIADALETAHAAGIVHRDIKPANLFITARGHAKVLDFGLAKVRTAGISDQTAAMTTALAGLTGPGTALGTVPYMSPEQVRAEELDARTDLFSFGVVLYEMATGVRPFQGESPGLIFDGILNREPAAAGQLNPRLPGELVRIIARCLEKDRERRYQHAAEIRADLQQLTRDLESGQPQTAGRRPAPMFLRRWKLWASAAAVVAIAAVAAAFYSRPPKLTDKDTIVLGDFTNTTGDPVFDETLRQGLAVELQQSPFLSLIPEERIRSTLALMNQPADARLTLDIAQGVCVRTASAAVLDGSIAPLGSQYVLGLRARNCMTGDILADEQAQAARKEEVLSTLSRIATRFRTRVGESLATIEKHSTPLEEATTPSLEAFQAFSVGQSATRATFDWRRRLPHYQRAIALDPEFAMAHAQIGFGLSSLGESTLGRQSLLKAYQLRERASDRERFNIETLYDRDYTGNLERERQTLETWAETYPRDNRPHSLLAGLALTSTGQYELAIAETDKALTLSPEGATPTYAGKARNQLHLNRVDDALLTVRQATERKLDSPDLPLIQYFVAFLKGTPGSNDELGRIVTLARKSPSAEDLISHVEALALARCGRLQDARRMSAVPTTIAQRAGQRERAGLFEAGRAVWEAFYGNAAAARQSASKALELGRGRDVDYAAAFALALSGDLPQARALAEGLAREYPEAAFVQFM